MPRTSIPPPGQRFHRDRWEPYPYRQFDRPDDPPSDAEAYLLKMGGYEIARIQRLDYGRWLGVVGTLWHRDLWRSDVFDDTRRVRSEHRAGIHPWYWPGHGDRLPLLALGQPGSRGRRPVVVAFITTDPPPEVAAAGTTAASCRSSPRTLIAGCSRHRTTWLGSTRYWKIVSALTTTIRWSRESTN